MDYSMFSGRVFVVCVGNELSGDDGFGPAVYSLIKDVPGVRAVDASTFPEAFVGEIIDYKPDLVVLLDAADFGGASGELRTIDPATIEQSHFSTHRAPLKLFVKSLAKEGIPVVLLCVQAVQTGLGEPLSPEVRDAVAQLTSGVLRIKGAV